MRSSLGQHARSIEVIPQQASNRNGGDLSWIVGPALKICGGRDTQNRNKVARRSFRFVATCEDHPFANTDVLVMSVTGVELCR